MALFDFLKKKEAPKQVVKQTSSVAGKVPVNFEGEPLDRLTADGELPWGWLAHNKVFVGKIGKEYTYFLNNWLASRNKEPLKQYEALKSFVLYMEDVKKLCESKGECFAFWFEEILTAKGYLEERKKELDNLQKNFDKIDRDYKSQQIAEAERARKVVQMRGEVIDKLKANDGVLQSDFWKLFDEADRGAVQDIVYDLVKAGKVERTKSGRSYLLHFK